MTRQSSGHAQWLRIVARLVVAVAVLGGAYAGLSLWLSGHLPANTTVAGINVGGMSAEQAASTLTSDLAKAATAPVVVRAGDDTVKLDPRKAGLSLDVDRTLEGLAGRTYDPGKLWDRLTGGAPEPLRVSIDRQRLESAVRQLAASVGRAGRAGSITFDAGRVKTVLPQQGRALDVGGTAAAVSASWPRQSEVKAVMTLTQPALSAAVVKKAEQTLAKPAMSAPVVVTVGKTKVTLTPTQLSPLLTIKPDGLGGLGMVLDGPGVLKAVRHAAPGVERTPVDATIRLVGTSPKVIPAVAGKVIDPTFLTPSVTAALTSDSRQATAKLITKAPEVTTQQAKDAGIKEAIAQFTSTMPGGPENEARTHNITTAVGHLNGTVVMPGKQFSLLGILGDVTASKGYVKAHVIDSGRLANALGGGISQVSTTVYNTAFLAGVQLDEHTAHSYYISRYPAGREATLWNPSIDNKWTNTSGHAILIETHVSGQDISMTFWGTKAFTVKDHTGPRRNVTAPKTIRDDNPACVPQSPGEGFDITVTREVLQGSKVVDSNTLNTHYAPSDRVICTRK